MPLNLETLDDGVILDKCEGFAGGVNSFSPASSLGETQFYGGVNVDQSVEGRLITRRGTQTAATAWSHPILGIGFFQTDAVVTYPSNLVVMVRDASAFGRFKIWDGANWQNPAAIFDYDPVKPVMMVQGVERLWIAQAGHVLTLFNGIGLLDPAAFGTGNPPVNPSIICWHTGRLICAGIPGAPEGLSMSQYFDGFTWDHANWDISIGDGDGDPIVGLVPWTNFNLVVLKQRSVWMINCNPSLADPITGNITGFPITCVHRQIGCIAGRSGIQVGADVMFLSDSGVRGVARTLASEQQNTVGPPLSEPVTDFINRINPAAFGQCVSYYWKNRYILSAPLDNATTPSHILIWNTLTNSWSGYWTGLTATCFTRRVVAGQPHLCFGQQDGSVVEFLDYVLESSETAATYQDQNTANPVTGVDYATQIIGRGFTLGEADELKTGLFARMEFNKSAANVTASVILDSQDEVLLGETFLTTSAAIDLPIDLPFDLSTSGIFSKSIDLMRFGQWFHLQLQLSCTSQKLSLNRFTIGAFLDSFRIQQ